MIAVCCERSIPQYRANFAIFPVFSRISGKLTAETGSQLPASAASQSSRFQACAYPAHKGPAPGGFGQLNVRGDAARETERPVLAGRLCLACLGVRLRMVGVAEFRR